MQLHELKSIKAKDWESGKSIHVWIADSIYTLIHDHQAGRYCWYWDTKYGSSMDDIVEIYDDTPLHLNTTTAKKWLINAIKKAHSHRLAAMEQERNYLDSISEGE